MIVTEEEARQKWCPFTRSGMHGINTLGGINRAPELTRPDGFVPGATDCIGSKCMAWRWFGDDGFIRRYAAESPGPEWEQDGDSVIAGERFWRTKAPFGYCGLAGKP